MQNAWDNFILKKVNYIGRITHSKNMINNFFAPTDTILDSTAIIEKVKKILIPYEEDVKFVFLFGSYARGEADNWSDIDIGIYFSKETNDDKKNEIRFKILDVLDPYPVHIGYLDDEETSPETFIAAAEGIPIVLNEEDIYHEELIKNIHRVEEMRSIGLIA